MVEEKARFELGMIRPDYIDVQIPPRRPASGEPRRTRRSAAGVAVPVRALLCRGLHALGSAVTWLEIVAFMLALVMVVCNIRVNPIGSPLAIVSSLMYVALFWKQPPVRR